MYIGPWQEYKLSQARSSVASKPDAASGGPDIREELQKTLLKTLDPESVAKVMLAMNPLLDTGTNDKNSGDQSDLPPLPSNRRHSRAARQHREKKFQTTLHDHFKLPSISNQYQLESPSGGQNTGTPHSVRSSKSEPLQSSRLRGHAQLGIRAFSPPPADTANRSGLNSANLIATLRLERRTRPTLKDAAKKADFGQFWSWKGEDRGDANSEQGEAIRKPKAKADVVDDKISRVKNMKKLYTSGPLEYKAPPMPALPSIDVTASPLRSYQKPQTPVIEDRDLTSTDLAVVSKYFRGNRSSSVLNEADSDRKHVDTTSIPRVAMHSGPISPSFASRSHTVHELDMFESNDENLQDERADMNNTLSPPGNPTRLVYSPVQVMDTGNFSSPDGLLQWTAMLNPNDIDSLY